jgi:hypothetical protein
LLAVALLAALIQMGNGASTALAAPAKPRSLAPSSTAVSGQPALSWQPVRGAATYQVQISTSQSFGTRAYDATTANRRATPTMNLPGGKLWWRVRGVTTSGVAGAWSTASFNHALSAGPALTGPANAEQLQQPDTPVLLSWQSVAGAEAYTIEVSETADFILTDEYRSRSTAFLMPDPGPQRTYFWRVRADLPGGYASRWSQARSFQVVGVKTPEITYPDSSDSTKIVDAVLDWKPVAGAVRYEVQISTDRLMSTIVHNNATVKSTRYARPLTLNNDQYWWRVRAIDVNNNESPWSQTLAAEFFQFQRHWPDQVNLLHPSPGSTVGAPFFYQWSPIKQASHFELQMGTDRNFSPGTYSSCFTKATTYTTRFGGDRCHPTPGTLFYWRVRGLDGPGSPAGRPPSLPSTADWRCSRTVTGPESTTSSPPARRPQRSARCSIEQ